MVAEERITTKFSGLVGAYGTRGGGDLPRHPAGRRGAAHAVLRALPGRGRSTRPATIAAHVERAREQVSPAFRKIFDEALVEAHEELVAAPDDLAAKVRFVTIYHLILESTLGLTTFRFVTEYLEARGAAARASSRATRRSTTTRPATSATASGSCARAVREHDEAAEDDPRDAARAAAVVAEALASADRDTDTDWDALGASTDEIREFALGGLTRRLEIIGTPL